MVNHQLIRYAGFRQADGTTLGDPDSVDFTDYCLKQGWKGRETAWTPLPWVMVEEGKPAPPFDPFHNGQLPPNEIILAHPDFPNPRPWVEVVRRPTLADMALKSGELSTPFAPFNGHYLEQRLQPATSPTPGPPQRAGRLGQGVQHRHGSQTRVVVQDEALVRLNQALLASFDEAGVTVGDHHEMGFAFEQWCQAEQRQGREVPGDWSWLTPPMSGSLTPQFHRHFSNGVVTHTNYFYQPPPEVNGMTYTSKAKETHRLLAPDAYADDAPPSGVLGLLGQTPSIPLEMTSHEIDYTIHGDDLQAVEVELDPQETVIAEAGAMNWMESDIAFEARMGDGSAASQGFLGD